MLLSDTTPTVLAGFGFIEANIPGEMWSEVLKITTIVDDVGQCTSVTLGITIM